MTENNVNKETDETLSSVISRSIFSIFDSKWTVCNWL